MTQEQTAVYEMNQKKGLIALLVSTTGMGVAGLLTRGATRVEFFTDQYVAGESIGALMTLGRMAMGLVMFSLLLVITRKSSLFRHTKVTPSIILGGLCIGIALSCYMVATLYTTLADAVFLIYTGPLFCTLLARLFRKEHISAFQWGCLGLVFVGMLLTAGIIKIDASGVSFGLSLGTATPEHPQKGMGDMLGLASGVFYGASLFFNGYRKDCDSIVRGVWNFGAATVGSLLVSGLLAFAIPLGDVAMSPTNWLYACALWIICGPLSLGLLLVAGRNLPAVEYSTIAYWECIVSLATSVLIYHETLSGPTIAGGILIIVGGALPALHALKHPSP